MSMIILDTNKVQSTMINQILRFQVNDGSNSKDLAKATQSTATIMKEVYEFLSYCYHFSAAFGDL